MLTYHADQLHADGVALADIVQRFGTPCYVYSRAAIEQHWSTLNTAMDKHKHLICYAVKANSNLAVLNILARLGSGFDIVSEGELERVLRAGGKADKIVFSGVGKTNKEIQRALQVGIKCFNVESLPELENLHEIAASLGKIAPVSLRINPDIDATTHPYIATGLKNNKFGIPFADALVAYQRADSMAHIDVIGIGCHIGSQITQLTPFVEALDILLELARQITAAGIKLKHINIGGGLGICYQGEQPPTAQHYAQSLCSKLADTTYEIILEPGRSIVGSAGVLITQVTYLKHTEDKNFAIVDTAMNDLLRPSLYGAWHEIMPVNNAIKTGSTRCYDLVGPICESGDFLAKDRHLDLQQDDLLAICTTGGYGFSMASTYNSRPKICEIMVADGQCHEIRRRQTVDELMHGETMLSS